MSTYLSYDIKSINVENYSQNYPRHGTHMTTAELSAGFMPGFKTIIH
jgi:hypothetical protein